jgi:pimeloyl-ACP methyl ester carboxylesterase
LSENEIPPQGQGFPILVLPGFGANGAATAYLRAKLGQLQFEVYDWEGGVNFGPVGDVDQWFLPLSAQLRRIHEKHGERVSIIGWSLGGVYAYELRKRDPELVRHVITLGTPFVMPSNTGGRHLDGSIPIETEKTAIRLVMRKKTEALARSLSIYSRCDGIVEWEKCMLPEVAGHSNVEAIGVDHFGMIYHAKVLRMIVEFLQADIVGQTAGC